MTFSKICFVFAFTLLLVQINICSGAPVGDERDLSPGDSPDADTQLDNSVSKVPDSSNCAADESTDICAICHDPLDDKCVALFECRHRLDQDCADKWSKACPTCRNVNPSIVVPLNNPFPDPAGRTNSEYVLEVRETVRVTRWRIEDNFGGFLRLLPLTSTEHAFDVFEELKTEIRDLLADMERIAPHLLTIDRHFGRWPNLIERARTGVDRLPMPRRRAEMKRTFTYFFLDIGIPMTDMESMLTAYTRTVANPRSIVNYYAMFRCARACFIPMLRNYQYRSLISEHNTYPASDE